MAAEKSVLIFGAGGFVGGYLAQEFNQHGYEVFGSDLLDGNNTNQFSVYKSCDITNSEAVLELVSLLTPSIIVNLAAISSVGLSWKKPQTTMLVNVNGALNVLEAAKCLSEPPKMLLIGSSEEYAISKMPLREDDELNASNPYGISKMAQERFADAYASRYGLKIYMTRSFNHTGPGQTDSFVIPNWCKQVAAVDRSGQAGSIKVGNLDVSRDFSDVRDVVRAYRQVVESEYYGEVFNVGSGQSYSLREILQKIVSFTDVEVKISIDSQLLRPVDNAFICADCTKIKKALGWYPKHELSETLRDVFDYYLNDSSYCE